jgi:hypothetical protein
MTQPGSGCDCDPGKIHEEKRTTAESPITRREKDFAAWYQDVVLQGDMAEPAEIVKRCMVIKPNGYAVWEVLQRELDDRLKATGHQNIYLPLLIPQSFFKKEAEHVEGFAPELAIVTIAGGKVLEEPYVIRPTSETIVGHFFAKWIKSYRDLPVLINQWANVLRWELRTDIKHQMLRDIAMERLYELDPDAAKPYILDEISHPHVDNSKGMVKAKTLGVLPQETLPEFDEILVARLERKDSHTLPLDAQLIARYSTKKILPRVKPLYETAPGRWDCATEDGFVLYFLRTEPDYGVQRLSWETDLGYVQF